MTNSAVDDIAMENNNESKIISCFRSMRTNFPRCSAILFFVFLPLWILVLIALLGGSWISILEAPEEYAVNDAIISARLQFNLSNSRKYEDKLVSLPTTCFYDYLKESNTSLLLPPLLQAADNASSPTTNITTENLLLGLNDRLIDCSIHAREVLDLHDEVQQQVHAVTIVPLTFHWIRCWDQQLYGKHNPFHPTDLQIMAASNQTAYYQETWQVDQGRLYEQYKDESLEGDPSNCKGITCYDTDALKRSLREATGRTECDTNRAAAAWFFFTIMTTVGYGNQAPVTGSGRNIVVFLGLFSILAFGAILASAGSIMSILFQDFVFHKRIKSDRHKLHLGCVWWALLTCLWILFLGYRVSTWWEDRISDLVETTTTAEVPNKWWDSMWFAFISLTTIGLGDYFLYPEVVFLSDVFALSWQFLIGFTFFSGFLAKLSAVWTHWTGASLASLEMQLQQTDPFSSSTNSEDSAPIATAADNTTTTTAADNTTTNSRTALIEMLEEQLKDENHSLCEDASIVAREQALLQQLLELRQRQRLLRME